MRYETVKSIILVVLIAVSLLLTLGIWTYQPQLETTSDHSPIEAKIEDGKEETKKNLIEPSKIIFHQGDLHQGYYNKNNEELLYTYMQSWSLYDFEDVSNEVNKVIESEKDYIEVIFPTELPIDLIQDIFTIDETEDIPGRVFDRIRILTNEEHLNNQMVFMHSKNDIKFTANIQNMAEAREKLTSLKNANQLRDFIVYQSNNSPNIYVPKEADMNRISFTAKSISKTTLRNILFDNPSAVRNSEFVAGEEKFTDGQREMVVYQKNYMEYINPISSETKVIDGRQLLNQILDFVNAHQGWTTEIKDEYVLYDLNVYSKTAQFRLTYDGVPIFSNNRLSTILVTMRNQNVYQYNRPLIQFGMMFDNEGQKVEGLETGQQVVTYLERSKEYSNRTIEDIAIGYKIEEQPKTQYVFNLEPKWHVKINNTWEELVFDDVQVSIGGDK